MKNSAVQKGVCIITFIFFLLALLIPIGYIFLGLTGDNIFLSLLGKMHLILPITYLAGIIMFVYLFCSVSADHVAHAKRVYTTLGVTAVLTVIAVVVPVALKCSEGICTLLIVLSGIVAIMINAWASSGKRIRGGYGWPPRFPFSILQFVQCYGFPLTTFFCWFSRSQGLFLCFLLLLLPTLQSGTVWQGLRRHRINPKNSLRRAGKFLPGGLLLCNYRVQHITEQ